MSDLHDLLERRAAHYAPPQDLLARVHERGRQRQRNRRVATGLTAVVVFALVAAGLSSLIPPSSPVVLQQPPGLFVGTWVSIDIDGSSQTMDISALDGSYEVVVDDDAASVCAGAPSTLVGTGRLDDARLVIARPTLQCDDGSTPVPLDGRPLDEILSNYTLVHDARTDALLDDFGVEWRRPTATSHVDTTAAPVWRGLWPQSSMEEVREAQERADAGDPAYTWQLQPAMGEVGGNAEIFTRFLTHELGWEEFRWGAEADHAESMHWSGSSRSSSVDFVRCAAGELNPLYPNDPEGSGCAPTLDDRAYETVRVTAYQPLGESPDGVWVVESSQRQPPFRQTVPPSDAEIAAAVGPFLQARIEGAGAEEGVGGNPARVPLLHATSDGARYERADYEVVDGPTWPFGIVHLNLRLLADGGEIVVEQPFRLEPDLLTVVQPQPPYRLFVLEYDPRHEPTTENGVPVPEPYDLLDGRVTFSAHPSWENVFFGPNGADVIGFYLENGYEQLLTVVGDPLAPEGSCAVGDRPASADELVRSLRSSPDLSVSAPEATRVGTIDAVQLDITSDDQGARCDDGPPVLAARGDPDVPAPHPWGGIAPDSRARVYVFDVPGEPARTVAILVMASQGVFERVLTAAQPVIESFELQGDR